MRLPARLGTEDSRPLPGKIFSEGHCSGELRRQAGNVQEGSAIGAARIGISARLAETLSLPLCAVGSRLCGELQQAEIERRSCELTMTKTTFRASERDVEGACCTKVGEITKGEFCDASSSVHGISAREKSFVSRCSFCCFCK